MYDSRSDHPHRGVHWDRANYGRESKFVDYNVFGRTYRSVHQEPAPDYDDDDEG